MGVSPPHASYGGGETPSKQTTFNNIQSNNDFVKSWRCLIMEKEAKRKWVVKVDDDAFFHSGKGWVCDCGNFTFGNDRFHVPMSGVSGRVRRGRVVNG